MDTTRADRLQGRRPLSLRARVVVYLLCVITGMAAVLGAVAWRSARQLTQAEAERTATVAALARADALVARITEQRDRADAHLAAALDGCGTTDVVCLQRGLSEHVHAEGALGGRLSLPTGPVLAAGTMAPDEAPARGELARFVEGDGGRTTYDVAAGEDGVLLLVAYDAARHLDPIFVGRDGLGEGGEVLLLDAASRFVTTPRFGPTERGSRAHAQAVAECLAGQDGQTVGLDYRGQSSVMAYRHVPAIGGGCVMAHLSNAEVLARARSLQMDVLVGFGAAVLAAGIFAMIIAASLSQPLVRITERARLLRAGDYRSPIPTEGPSEVWDLAETLSELVVDLDGQSTLGSASQALAEALDTGQVADAAARPLVPGVADWAAVFVDAESGDTVLAGITTVESGQGQAIAGMARGGASPAMLADAGGPSIAVPLTARGRPVGMLVIGRFGARPFRPADRSLAERLAERAGPALANAMSFETQRDAAVSLQRSLLPEQLPEVPGLALASRYLAGAVGSDVGGDWYDVIPLPDGRVALAVGDVMGRGVGAAAVMGQVRAALRGFALDGRSPDEVLARLDAFLDGLTSAQLATCIYAIHDPVTGTLELSSAGHPPPVLVEPGRGPRLVESEPGPPLGIGGCTYAVHRVVVPDQALLLLYSDGLVEGAELPIDEGIARLCAALSEPFESAEDACDRALAAMAPDGADDDTAILAIGFTSAKHPTERASLSLMPTNQAPAEARRFLRETLHEWAIGCEVAALLVSELVTNALVHARGDIEVQVQLEPGVLHIAVADADITLPQLREFDLDAEHGRGILLVESLAQRWGTERSASGKRVWFEVDVDDVPARRRTVPVTV